jgi:hypothetical protein
MEIVAAKKLPSYSRYGSSMPKQVYIYGALDTGPTLLRRGFGFTWGVGGWLLTPFLQKLAPADVQRLHGRVVSGLKTTFASRYKKTLSLPDALSRDAVSAYVRRATGEKYLIAPNRGV